MMSEDVNKLMLLASTEKQPTVGYARRELRLAVSAFNELENFYSRAGFKHGEKTAELARESAESALKFLSRFPEDRKAKSVWQNEDIDKREAVSLLEDALEECQNLLGEECSPKCSSKWLSPQVWLTSYNAYLKTLTELAYLLALGTMTLRRTKCPHVALVRPLTSKYLIEVGCSFGVAYDIGKKIGLISENHRDVMALLYNDRAVLLPAESSVKSVEVTASKIKAEILNKEIATVYAKMLNLADVATKSKYPLVIGTHFPTRAELLGSINALLATMEERLHAYKLLLAKPEITDEDIIKAWWFAKPPVRMLMDVIEIARAKKKSEIDTLATIEFLNASVLSGFVREELRRIKSGE